MKAKLKSYVQFGMPKVGDVVFLFEEKITSRRERSKTIFAGLGVRSDGSEYKIRGWLGSAGNKAWEGLGAALVESIADGEATVKAISDAEAHATFESRVAAQVEWTSKGLDWTESMLADWKASPEYADTEAHDPTP